jgi:hypothetical protein
MQYLLLPSLLNFYPPHTVCSVKQQLPVDSFSTNLAYDEWKFFPRIFMEKNESRENVKMKGINESAAMRKMIPALFQFYESLAIISTFTIRCYKKNRLSYLFQSRHELTFFD